MMKEPCRTCTYRDVSVYAKPCVECVSIHSGCDLLNHYEPAAARKTDPVFKGLEHAYDEQMVEAHEILAEDSQNISPESMVETLRELQEDPGVHYRHFYKGIELDPYRIALVYALTDHMEFFILKKVLRMGSAHKDKRQELKDIINAAQRRLDVLDEDAA